MSGEAKLKVRVMLQRSAAIVSLLEEHYSRPQISGDERINVKVEEAAALTSRGSSAVPETHRRTTDSITRAIRPVTEQFAYQGTYLY